MKMMDVDECMRMVRTRPEAIRGPDLVMDQKGIAYVTIMSTHRFEEMVAAADDWRDLSSPAIQAAVARIVALHGQVTHAVERGDLVPLSQVSQEYLNLPEYRIWPHAPWAVYLDANARKQIDTLTEMECRLVATLLKSLELEPKPRAPNVTLMVGALHLYRLVSDGVRVLYHVDEAHHQVFVVGITSATWDIPEPVAIESPETEVARMPEEEEEGDGVFA